MNVLDPIPSSAGDTVISLASRPSHLRGLRPGVLDNTGVAIHRGVKPGSSVPAADHDALAAGADVFVSR